MSPGSFSPLWGGVGICAQGSAEPAPSRSPSRGFGRGRRPTPRAGRASSEPRGGRPPGTRQTSAAAAVPEPEPVRAAALARRPGISAPHRAREPTFRGSPRNRKWPGPRRRDQRSGSHSVRQWRRREDEQQVRRVSGVRPPPGAPSLPPQRFPAPVPAAPGGGANPAASGLPPGRGLGLETAPAAGGKAGC